MKKKMMRFILLMTTLLMVTGSFTGCKASKKKVLESTYYKELLSKYNKLEKENKKLKKASDTEEERTDAEKRAEKFLAKIARNQLVRVEVGYPDQMEDSHYIEEAELYQVATNLAKNAKRCTEFTPEELKKSYKVKYIYMIYDEDNAIYEMNVYDSNYVTFSDLPKYVYYIPDASALGDAYLKSKISVPSSTLLHTLSESPLMVDSKKNYYENSTICSLASCMEKVKKQKSSREKAVKEWKKIAKTESDSPADYEPNSVTYTFFHHGDYLTVTLYDRYINILNADGKRIWYRVTKTDIFNIKNVLKKDREARKASAENQEKNGTETTKKTDEKKSHSKQIEEESIISNE
ncbi:MAG: hypothetical protein Q4E53_01915 [Eubacteriales bacterium]|nr:hypothetical protein [Eubacteriales bacterium]